MHSQLIAAFLLLSGCAKLAADPLAEAQRAIAAEYPGGKIWSVVNRLPSGEVVVCGYEYLEGGLSNAFVWHGGKLLSPVEVAAMQPTRLTRLCGPDYVSPSRIPRIS